jgi:Secretion system C-terminal sorting domain
MKNKIKKLFIASMLLFSSMRMSAQADLGIGSAIMNANPISVGQVAQLVVDIRNFGFTDITTGCALINISVPSTICSITSLNPGSDPIWAVFSSALPASITIRNTGGDIPADLNPYLILINIQGTSPGGPLTINVSAALAPGFIQAGCLALGNLDGFNDAAQSSITVLPALSVHLSTFDATVSGCKTTLEWVSQQEENSKEYQVQVSHDGRTFVTIGTVAAAGNSTITRSYNYTDNSPYNGYNYYRLKIVELDGKTSYSSVVTVKAKCDGKNIRLFPNPVMEKNNLTVIITGHSNNLKGELIDISGKVLRTFNMKNGSNTVLIEAMAQGNYVLRVTDASTRVSESFKVVVIK